MKAVTYDLTVKRITSLCNLKILQIEREKTMKTVGFRYRWFVENCHEFQLPGGKTLLIDPMLPRPNSRLYDAFKSGFTVDDLERVDYVFISHIHGDHIDQLKEVVDKFNPFILIGQNNIIPLAKAMNLPVRKMIPLTDYHTYDFGCFKFTPYPGTHVQTVGDLPLNEEYENLSSLTGEKGDTVKNEAQAFGSCFNTNFMLEIPGGMRIAFIQGQYTDLTKYEFMHSNPTLLIRQLSRIDLFPEVFDQLVDCIEDTNTGIMAFMCHHHKTKDPVKTAADINKIMQDKKESARVFVPKSGQLKSISIKLIDH
jgi:hypothetical protein